MSGMPQVAIVYDAITKEITQTAVPATTAPVMRGGERCVMVALSFYRQAKSIADLRKMVPQLAR